MKTKTYKSKFQRKLFQRTITLFFISILIITGGISKAAEKTNEWILNTTVDNVNFYYKIVNCNNDDFVLLKFENNNDMRVTVSWTEKFILSDVPDGFQSKKTKSLDLSPGITSQENCEQILNKDCTITIFEIDPTYHPSVTGYGFENIQINGN